ncbi:hypothetical protein LX24_00659 [Desulfallas thermosapovorans DSM 6562]|uniref:Uncharacterized protein n=1 Tax=Desulfallas thermosapovorans DSM 6562 TaxID=1121431 RepID=A0A5S4ZX67_9FIRM|nr:hypothetical protein LX24_00659 [Desulfallas thermosapovorans DSM 6562]
MELYRLFEFTKLSVNLHVLRLTLNMVHVTILVVPVKVLSRLLVLFKNSAFAVAGAG